jgi:hypothetical protein
MQIILSGMQRQPGQRLTERHSGRNDPADAGADSKPLRARQTAPRGPDANAFARG